MKVQTISILFASFCPFGLAPAALLVDFSGDPANVAPNAAGFIVASGSMSPQTATFIAGTQGYTSSSMDTGAGIVAQLRVYATTGIYVNLLQIRNRDVSAADLESDWVFQSGTFDGELARVGLRLTLTGMKSGVYGFSSLHVDTGSMIGVVDVQYSLNGGSTWINSSYDNASFTDGLVVSLPNLNVTETSGLQVRYLVGGNLFGAAGVARSGDSNFLVPLNSFSLAVVPEPSIATLGILGIATLLMRRRIQGFLG